MTQPFVSITLEKESVKLLKDMEANLGADRLKLGIVSDVMDRQGKLAAGSIVRNYLSGQKLGRRTGQLALAMEGRGEMVRDRGGAPAMRVGVFRGPALRYARAHEYGAEIVAKKAKALAIPTDEVLTSAGVDKFGGPRNFPGTLIPFRGNIAVGALYDEGEIARLKTGTVTLKDLRAAYILVKKVKLPAQHYLRDGFKEYLPTIAQALARYVADVTAGKRVLDERGGTKRRRPGGKS